MKWYEKFWRIGGVLTVLTIFYLLVSGKFDGQLGFIDTLWWIGIAFVSGGIVGLLVWRK